MGDNIITLFTIPRAFEGKHKLIQENAIKSWTLLKPKPEIFLCCNDKGVERAVKKFGCRHVPNMFRSKWGIPFVRDAFGQVQDVATNDLMAYVNTDILLRQKFVKALVTIGEKFKQFLMIGQRIDCPYLMERNIDFSEGWSKRLKLEARRSGTLHPTYGIDFFGFRRGLYGKMPPFAVGRAAWDNWLVWWPLHKGYPVVDITPYLKVLHIGEWIKKYKGNPEREHNRSLVPKEQRRKVEHATWVLSKKGLRRK